MKPIHFKETSSQRVYDQYILRCRRVTRILSEADREDALMEINSHIFEYMSEHSAGDEMKTLLDVLDRLGAPEETLRHVVADKKIKQATTTHSPLHLLQALALNMGNGFIYVILSVMMLLLVCFPALAILKIFIPSKVGAFTGDNGGFFLGFSDHPAQYHEWLGAWFIPLMLAGALVLYYIVITLLTWTRKIKEKKMRLKASMLSVLFIISASNSFSQGIAGDWNGKLKAGTQELRVVFHVSKTGDLYNGTMDSPDQGAKGIAFSSVKYQHDTLVMELISAQIKYAGVLRSDSAISGVFSQGGQSFPLDLTRQTGAPQAVRRPQEPVKPYPYYSEDVHFTNTRDHIDLAGTLTLPGKEGNFPAVVLITGSGPQNRDEEILGHKPFLIISDYLTRHGVAVLRFDDRGTAESNGVFNTATTLDFSYDAEAAVRYLQSRKEINKSRIGLMGHSEGGLIAPMIAARSKDVAFIVLLAGPGLRGDSLLLLQQTLIGKASGESDSDLQKQHQINRVAFNMILNMTDTSVLKRALQTYLDSVLKSSAGAEIPKGVNKTDYLNHQIKLLTSPWMRFFLTYDPASALKRVKCPVLAIGGDKDLQVPAEIDLRLIKKYLSESGNTASGNKDVTVKILPGLNHLFQDAQTGSPDEYSRIEETFSPVALRVIGDWILNRFSASVSTP